jgi:hypothetical protein
MKARMRRHECAAAAIGLALVWVAVDLAMTKQGLFAQQCALRDAAAAEWIEQQANTKAMPPPLLAEAAFTVLRARNACMHGKTAEALTLYDSVLMPVDVQTPSSATADR